MSEQTTQCETCKAYIHIGEHPFCPHGYGGGSARRDDIPGGLTVENYGPNPITFYSHSERRAYMAQHGLVEKEKWCPMPGTDRDPQGVQNPRGYMDAQTMDNARVLLSRPGAQHEAAPEVEGVIRGSFNVVGTGRDAKAIASGDPRRQSRLARRILR